MADNADIATTYQENMISDGIAAARRSLSADVEQLTDDAGNVICMQCEEQLPARRLELFPNSTLCVTCKEESERG